MKRMIAVVAAMAMLVAFADDVEVVKVKGRGVGADKTEALKDAYRDAVERAVGLYVDAEQMVKNEELVTDQILTQSNAYIEKYDIAKESKSGDGQVSVTILADVRQRALTRRIRDIMPSSTIDLSDISKDLHAQIVTDFKANDDALTIIRNELKDLQPLKQLMKVTLGTTKPVVESVKEDASMVRLWYPIKVEVENRKYYEEFAPRWARVLDQIKTSSAKRLDLHENALFADAYEEMITEKFGTSRKTRKGVMTRCDVPRDAKWPHYNLSDCLYKFGLSLNEEFEGFKFLDVRISGKDYVLHSCHVLPTNGGSIPYSFNRRDLYDHDKPKDKLIIRAFRNSSRDYGLLEEISGDCDFVVGLVTAASKNKLMGYLYTIPQDCREEILAWQHLTACGTQKGYRYQETAPETDVVVRFVDKDSTEVVSTIASFRNLDLLNFGCVLLEEPRWSNGVYVGGKRLWLITPLVGSVANNYVKWVSTDLPKEDVAKISKVTIGFVD